MVERKTCFRSDQGDDEVIEYLYSCTCNKAKRKFVSGLGDFIKNPLSSKYSIIEYSKYILLSAGGFPS